MVTFAMQVLSPWPDTSRNAKHEIVIKFNLQGKNVKVACDVLMVRTVAGEHAPGHKDTA